MSDLTSANIAESSSRSSRRRGANDFSVLRVTTFSISSSRLVARSARSIWRAMQFDHGIIGRRRAPPYVDSLMNKKGGRA
jgi:hypothetical protein